MTPEQAAALREPFPAHMIGGLPKAGMTLDYVGHAAVTDRLLQVDPGWTWEPFAVDGDGGPLIRFDGAVCSLWVRLTVCGVTRVGVGSVATKAGEREKQLVSDAIRNAAMRFGVALDLWSKEELHDPGERPEPKQRRKPAERRVLDGWESTDELDEAHTELAARIKACADDGLTAAARQFKVDHGWPMPQAAWVELERMVADVEQAGRPFVEGES